MTERISMSQKELKRYGIISQLIKGLINGSAAAVLLGLSIRQTMRLKATVKKKGAKGLVHGNRGKKSNRQINPAEKKKIIGLLHKHYHDFKPGLAAEKLEERDKIKRDAKTIRGIMIEEKLWTPKKKRNGSEYRSWRERKACFGEMEQFDGSYEHWLEDRNNSGEICLLAAIDDATSIITHAEFVKDEGVMPVFNFWKEYLQKRGKPHAIYLDKFSTYKMSQSVAIENHELKTQFQRALCELRIEPIFANSPQAKGRVERLFGTLQDRLIKEMRLAKINTIKEANEFLKQYIPKFNKRFAVEPKNRTDLHRSLTEKESRKLDGIFSRQTGRVAQNDFTISFNNSWYQLLKDQPITVCKRDKVIVEEHTDGNIKIRLNGKYLNWERLPEYAKKPYRAEQKLWVLAATATAVRAIQTNN